MSELPKPTWEGTFRLFGVDVKCAVVEGQRIIEAESMTRLLEAMEAGAAADSPDMEAFARWQKSGA